MGDLIDRKEAIKAIIGKTNDEIVEQQVIDAISDVPSAEPEWIPVEEQLPEKDGLYLVTYMVWKPVIDFSLFKMKKWHGLVSGEWTDYWYQVTAWMPLPEPYKGGDA